MSKQMWSCLTEIISTALRVGDRYCLKYSNFKDNFGICFFEVVALKNDILFVVNENTGEILSGVPDGKSVLLVDDSSWNSQCSICNGMAILRNGEDCICRMKNHP